MEIGFLTLGIYAVQILLLPTHLITYLSRTFDLSRLRFLLLSVIYFGFSGLWYYSQVNLSTSVNNLVLIGGLITAISVLYYFIVELNLYINSKRMITFGIIGFLVVCLKFLLDNMQIADWYYHLAFEILAILTSYPLLVQCYGLGRVSRRKPLYISGISSFYVLLLVPIVTLLFSVPYLKFLFFSLGYLLVLWAYYTHYFRQMKFENSSSFSKGRLNLEEYSKLKLVDRYYIADNIFGDYNLNERELEVATLLLAGATYKEIAERLFLDYSTIRGYASKVYNKTNVFGNKRPEQFRKKFGKPID